MNSIFVIKFCALSLVLLFALQAFGSRLEGFEPDYAGRNIEFYTWTDPISKTDKKAFTLRIGPQGRIQVETGVTETLFCYADFDSYQGKIIIVPGETLKIKLPPLNEKTFEESKNPYFQPITTWILAQSGSREEMNTLFARFDQRFYRLNQKYFDQLYMRQQRNYLDSVRIQLEREFRQIDVPLFKHHMELQLKTVEAGIMRAGREKLMAGMSGLPAQVWKLPAFADLVDRLFTNTLSIESKSAKGAAIRNMVARRNVAELRKWTESYTGTTSPLSDLLSVKMLHDAFYSGEFSKIAIIQILQSESFTRHTRSDIRSVAASAAEKLQFLFPGTKAPVIVLPTLAGDTIYSTSSSKPYQYILFADLEIPVGQEQVKYLTEINQRIGSRVDILLVLTPSTRVNNLEFIRANNIPGRIVLDTETKTMGRKYKVRSYPSAYLVNREHKVILAPAKTPLDGFEHQLAGVRD
jgi:hypothetical protein